MLNSAFWSRIVSLYGSLTSPVVVCMQISMPSIRFTSLYESQPVPLAFAFKPAPFGAELQLSISPRPHLSSCACKNSMICTRMTSLYGFQPLSVFFSSFKTVTLGPVLQVSMGPSPHVWFCACKSATLAHELPVSIGTNHHVWFLDAKQQILDWGSVGQRPHLLFLLAKLRLLDQNNKSVWVPDLTCRFVHAKQRV